MPKIYDSETKERVPPVQIVDAAGAQITSFSPSLSLATTSSVTSVNDTASSTTLLSGNSSRRGFRLQNDSTQVAYVKYGTTASTTDYTVQLLPGAYLEEDNYTGRVDCIWAADASGAMKITELT